MATRQWPDKEVRRPPGVRPAPGFGYDTQTARRGRYLRYVTWPEVAFRGQRRASGDLVVLHTAKLGYSDALDIDIAVFVSSIRLCRLARHASSSAHPA